MSDLPVRDIARAIVLDRENRLLLIAYEAARDVDPARPGLRQVWVLPGGGVEPGETHDAALKRELEEEIGARDITIGPWVGRCEGPFLLFRKPRFARERYAVARLADDRIDTARLTESENNPVLGVRWWSLPDLDTTTDVIEPRGLAGLVRRIVSGESLALPVVLHWGAAGARDGA